MNTTQGQLRGFVYRVLRLKKEQDALSEGIKEIYAEAKATGLDKTAMGQLVAYLRKREKSPLKLEENTAQFETYLAAYDAGTEDAREESHTHEAHARDLPPHDADGVLIEEVPAHGPVTAPKLREGVPVSPPGEVEIAGASGEGVALREPSPQIDSETIAAPISGFAPAMAAAAVPLGEAPAAAPLSGDDPGPIPVGLRRVA